MPPSATPYRPKKLLLQQCGELDGRLHTLNRTGFDGEPVPHMYLTDEWKSHTLARIQELVAEAQVRADALIAEQEAALIVVATAVYEQRRLADDRLNTVLESAGFTLPRPTA